MLVAFGFTALAIVIAVLALFVVTLKRDLNECELGNAQLLSDIAASNSRNREWERDMLGTVHALESAEHEASVWHERSDALATANLELVESVTNLETSVETLHAELLRHELARAAGKARRSGDPRKRVKA